jgi:glyoxalase family protein
MPGALTLAGLHHLTAVSANAPGNHDFYTRVLGMRLVKKTVNQDDVSAYHLFYGDGEASPGSDVTFFEWPVPRETRGTNSITRTSLRVTGAAALDYWERRLADQRVGAKRLSRDGRETIDFEDFEGQRLSILDDGGAGEGRPWAQSPVPVAHQIRGLGPVVLTVADLPAARHAVEDILGFTRVRSFEWDGHETHVFSTGAGGPSAEVNIVERNDLPSARQGAGAVHHVAFRTTMADYEAWVAKLTALGVPSSGPVDRYWFQSLYFREPNGILFEIATDEPGFATDEPLDRLGTTLSLPPFLEPRRAKIEAGLKPL